MKNFILSCSLLLAVFLISPNLKAEDCREKEIWISEKDSIECINIKYPSACEFTAVQKAPDINTDDIIKNLKYPSKEKEEGISTTILIKILVNKQGKIIKYVVEQSDNENLFKAALDAILKSEVKPAINNKVAIDCWITIPIKFSLR